jgi:hypothetical protein
LIDFEDNLQTSSYFITTEGFVKILLITVEEEALLTLHAACQQQNSSLGILKGFKDISISVFVQLMVIWLCVIVIQLH